MSHPIEFTVTLVGERRFGESMIDRLSVPVLYEQSIPQFPEDLDALLEPNDQRTHPRHNWRSISKGDETTLCKVGIVADVHQNTLVLAALLDRFADESVSVLFCLGDYSFTKEPDIRGIRAMQLGKSLELVARWLSGDSGREAVVLMGNHEIEDWYFGQGTAGTSSKAAVEEVLRRWRGTKRMHFTREPLSSYEIDNSLDVTLYYGTSRRSFRLSHAITKEFVVALYLGLDPARIEDSRQRIASNLGKSWLEVQSVVHETVRERWNRFLAAPPNGNARKESAEEICAYLRAQMTTRAFLSAVPKSAGNVYENAQGYLFMLREVLKGCLHSTEALGLFWGPPAHIETEFTDLEFALDLRRFYSALGIGRMYSLCGHFHADLGLFEASEEFGTHMIAVGGLQPRKIIGDSFSAYILECGKRKDTLYRLETPDDSSLGEFDWDLTYPLCKSA